MLNILSNLFPRKISIWKFYFAWNELWWESQEEFNNRIKTHWVNYEEFIRSLINTERWISMELYNDNSTIFTSYFPAFALNPDDTSMIAWTVEWKFDLTLRNWPIRSTFYLKISDVGPHSLWGEIPVWLSLPRRPDLSSSFQYIGNIDCTTEKFKRLERENLFLIYPLFECNYWVYLDYTDQFNPVILNPEGLGDSWYEEWYENLHGLQFPIKYYSEKELEIESNKTVEVTQYPEFNHTCWIPMRQQWEVVPSCIKCNKTMKFVCQIEWNQKYKASNSEKYKQYFKYPDRVLVMDTVWGASLYYFYCVDCSVFYTVAQFW